MVSVANTPTKYYIDSKDVKSHCHKNFKTIDSACKPEDDSKDNKKNKSPSLKKILGKKRAAQLDSMMRKGGQNKANHTPNKDTAWMEHCDGLWVKPSTANIAQEFNDQLQGLVDDLAKGIDDLIEPLLGQVGDILIDGGLEVGGKAVKSFLRSLGRWAAGLTGVAAGGVGGIATEAVATGLNILDWIETTKSIGGLSKKSYDALEEIKNIYDFSKKSKQELDVLLKDASKMTPTELMGNVMGVLARMDACTRARRCLLVPYKKTGTDDAMGGKGCCPGQTGHHVIPNEAVGSSCSGYSENDAPTICVEGVNNGNGTHGQAHDVLSKEIERYKESGWFKEKDEISYKKMRDLAIDSVQMTFPESLCNKECLRAQLDAYYKNKCTQPMKPAAGKKASKNGSNDRKDK